MAGHLAAGGLIVAATHQPLGIRQRTPDRAALRGGPGGRARMTPFRALLARDLKLAARIGGSGWLGLVFFLMIVTLVPFALGPDLNLFPRIGPAILWIAAVLATLIGLDRLFQADEEDGSLTSCARRRHRSKSWSSPRSWPIADHRSARSPSRRRSSVSSWR